MFASWRFNEDGSPKMDFILNQEGYTDSTILVGDATSAAAPPASMPLGHCSTTVSEW